MEHDDVQFEDSLYNYQLARDRVRRKVRKPSRYAKVDLINYALPARNEPCYDEPTTYKDAMTCKVPSKWKLAMDEKYKPLMQNRIWVLVPKPKGSKIVGCRCFFFQIKRYDCECGTN